MYRRAMAALELGKRDWARLDLWMALDVDPNNKEVIKKLHDLKEVSTNQPHGVPLGLGIGLSSPKKQKKSEVMDKEGVSKLNSCNYDEDQQLTVMDSTDVQQQGGKDVMVATKQEEEEEVFQQQVSGTNEPNQRKMELIEDSMEKSSEVLENGMMEDISFLSEKEDNLSNVGAICDKGPSVNEVSTIMVGEKVKEDIENGADSSSMSAITAEGDMLSTVCENMAMNKHSFGGFEERTSPDRSSSSCLTEEDILSQKNECLNLTEPKIRFCNRKSRGSCLTLSKQDYNVLVQGKTIKCYNSRLGSFMELKFAMSHDANLHTKSIDHLVEKHAMNSAESKCQSDFEEEVQDNYDIIHSTEASSGVSSCMDYEDNQAISVEGNYSSPSSKATYFAFSAKPTTTSRIRRFDAMYHSSSKRPVKSIKRRKLPTCNNNFSPNIAPVCRFENKRKRKGTHPPLGFNHHPRKKLATHAPSYSCTFDCPCSSTKSSLSSSESAIN